jgi:acetylxylan esterase
MPSMKSALALLLSQALLATNNQANGALVKRQCPGIHVFGARETTVSAGYGSSATVVNLIIAAYPGTTSEALNYPACGGQASCGGIQYNASVVDGINAAVTAIDNFHTSCPNTQLVLVGYSQVCLYISLSICPYSSTISILTRNIKGWSSL